MQREELIDRYFTNISLNKDYLDLYYVRRSLHSAIKSTLSKFSGILLDVGCGIMPYREMILAGNSTVSKYIGLDYESSITEEYSMGKPDLFWKGEIIPLSDNSVDTVIATELFEHCPEPELVMKEILRVLKPGGILFFTVPFLWNLHVVPYDEYRYTPYSLQRHLKNSGFINTDLTALGGWDASLAQMIGIWFKQSTLSRRLKKYLNRAVIIVMKKLIQRDARVNKKELFKEGSMITGISGIAYKELN